MFFSGSLQRKATGVSFRNKSVKLSRLSVADPDLQPLGPQFGLKIRGAGPPLDPPLSLLYVRRKCIDSTSVHVVNSKTSTLRTFLGNV